MEDNFNLEIISPSKLELKNETNSVVIPSYEGYINILKDHINLITFLKPGIVTALINNKEEIFFLEDGIVEFENNNLLILSSKVIKIDQSNKYDFTKDLSEAERELNKDLTDKERYMISQKIETLKNLN